LAYSFDTKKYKQFSANSVTYWRIDDVATWRDRNFNQCKQYSSDHIVK